MLQNTPARFGRVTRALHWITAALILCQLPLGFYTARMQPGLANLWLFGLHKTLGLTALALVGLRILWHLVTPPPRPLGDPAAWENRLARTTHRCLYALMLALPLAGWVASSASGLDTLFLNRWAVPPIAPVSEAVETAGFALHRALAWAMLALVALHIARALRRGWSGDGTLSRMMRGR